MKKYYIIFIVILSVFLVTLKFASASDTDFFKKLISLHKVKTSPGPYDWLATHPEPGQTYTEYIKGNPVIPNATKKYIDIVLLGEFSEKGKEVISKTSKYIEIFYDMPVRFIDPISLSVIPDYARREHPRTKDKQILSGFVIEEVLKDKVRKDTFCLISFTSSDLWPGQGWNFVFGEASMEDRVGVWSIYRNGDPERSEEDFKLCLKRTIKTGVHEIGHMFSMYHCIFYECLMNGSNHQKESDQAPIWLCPVCLRKLSWVFNQREILQKSIENGQNSDKSTKILIERFQKLSDICEEFGLEEEKAFFYNISNQEVSKGLSPK